MNCAKFWVSGRVQGVFFRESTRRQALALGLTGYARNLRDGRVEVLACGSLESLATLEVWLADGPPLARVESLRREAVADVAPEGFVTS